MIGAHQRGKARAAQKAAAKATCTALTNLVTLIGGRNQTDRSRRNPRLQAEQVLNRRHEVHQKEDAERGWTQGEFKDVQWKHRVNTHNRDQALSILETIRGEDEAELTGRTMANGSEKRLSSTAARRRNHEEEKRGHAQEEMRSRRNVK